LHGVFGCPRGPGLTDVLRGEVSPQRAFVTTAIERLWLLPMGSVPRNPAELLGSRAMRELLAQLSGEHNVTVLDVPPVLAAADASVIAAMADATVLVVRAGQTNETEARQALQQLAAVGARVAGAVLNDQDATVERYGDYQYTKYYGPVEASS
jgi:capsular exopolysaccharide synthesis family protein